jgi:hypothetical protein
MQLPRRQDAVSQERPIFFCWGVLVRDRSDRHVEARWPLEKYPSALGSLGEAKLHRGRRWQRSPAHDWSDASVEHSIQV